MEPRERTVEAGAAGPVLRVAGLRSTFVDDVSFDVGAGRSSASPACSARGGGGAADAVAGALRRRSGTFTVGASRCAG